MDKLGFDNQKYLELQSAHIRERIRQFGNKLYLEFGGKLFDDHHASRCCPVRSRTARSVCSRSCGTRWRWSSPSAPATSRRTRSGAIWASPTTWTCCGLIDAFPGGGPAGGSVAITQYAGQPPPTPSAAGWSTWGCRPASTTPSQATPTTPA